MPVNLVAMSSRTGIKREVLEVYLAPPEMPADESQLGEAIEKAETLKEINRLCGLARRGSQMFDKAEGRKRHLLEIAAQKAETMDEWYEIYRYGFHTKPLRQRALKELEKMFYVVFDTASTLEQLMELYQMLPGESRHLNYLRRKLILRLSTYFGG